MRYLVNGFGASVGGSVVTAKPVYKFNGDVWYVSSDTGVDNALFGKDREHPLATIQQAITNSSTGDMIVLMLGHNEVLPSRVSIAKSLYIAGEGLANGLPTVSFRSSSAADNVFDIAAVGVDIDNVLFPESLVQNAGNDTLTTGKGGAKLYVRANDCRVKNCYFQQGSKDQLAAIMLYGVAGISTNRPFLQNTTILSTAVAAATPASTVRPTYGIRIPAGSSDMMWEGLVLSDGTVGFSGIAADCFDNAQLTFQGRNVSLLLGASARFHASTTGFLHVGTATGAATVEG